MALDHLSPTARVWIYSLVVCFSVCLFGGDTGSIGSITQMPQFISHFGEMSEFLRGFVVAVILIPSAVTGLLAGSLADRIGRKRTISLGCLIFAAGMVICVAAPNLIALILGRCLAGSGEGFFLSAGAVYLCEISPKHLRGQILTVYQMFLTGALALGFFVCYGSIKIQNNFAWRLPMIISASVALGVGISVNFLPFSPRWLVTKGRKPEAEQVLNLITEKSAEEERKELLSAPPTDRKTGWTDIFSKGVRGRTFLATFLNVFQQLSGIDFVLFYAPLLFAQAGLDPTTSSFVASGATGISLFFISALGSLYVDRIGRRPLFIWGGVVIACCHTCIGALYASGAAYTPAGKWTIVALIEIFAAAFSATWALIVRLYCAEIQPSRTRSAASSFGQGANQLVNTVVALTSPAFLAKSPYGPYFLYGGLSAFGTAVAYVYMQETLGKSLETIDVIFESTPIAIAWPGLVKATAREGSSSAVRRSSSRGRASQALDENGRPFFPGKMFAMERLGSSMTASGLHGSAIEE